jgi:hypothetical protein
LRPLFEHLIGQGFDDGQLLIGHVFKDFEERVTVTNDNILPLPPNIYELLHFKSPLRIDRSASAIPHAPIASKR